MKRLANSILSAMILLALLPLSTRAAELLIPVGEIIGLQLRDDSVTVAAYDDSMENHAKSAGLKIGDEILKIDGQSINCAEDVRSALNRCGGAAEITVLRSGKPQTLQIAPRQTEEGPRLGVYLRQGIAGIGTVTFYDPETRRFGSLGHGVSDARGDLLKMTSGTAYEASILSVVKGKCGEPGQLKGTAESSDACGSLLRNTPQGVFGINKTGWQGEPLPVADYADIRTGEATIRSTIQGDSVQEYSVEILKIYPEDRSDHRNFLLKVTDPDLLAATGGIVQGMGVSYNKDNQDNSLACRGVWCQSIFSLTTKVEAYQAQVCWTESLGFCDRDAWAKFRLGGLYRSILYKQATTYSCHTGCRCRTGSVTPFGIFLFLFNDSSRSENIDVFRYIY